MAAVLCPWCQSEIPVEEGQEPDKFCPVCDNEIDGYRTLRIGIDEEDEDEEEDGASVGAVPLEDEEDLSWMQDDDLHEKDESLIQFEETVEKLLDEQEVVPECPQCREYMLETGQQIVTEAQFQPRVSKLLASRGGKVLEAPFALTVYLCPSCFTVQHSLSEGGRDEIIRRLAEEKE